MKQNNSTISISFTRPLWQQIPNRIDTFLLHPFECPPSKSMAILLDITVHDSYILNTFKALSTGFKIQLIWVSWHLIWVPPQSQSLLSAGCRTNVVSAIPPSSHAVLVPPKGVLHVCARPGCRPSASCSPPPPPAPAAPQSFPWIALLPACVGYQR